MSQEIVFTGGKCSEYWRGTVRSVTRAQSTLGTERRVRGRSEHEAVQEEVGRRKRF
jgi:hypothetical protein